MEESIGFTPDFGAKENSAKIKVIGVGGAGCNAVHHMFLEGIKDVEFLVCNTDAKHLEKCEIQEQLLIGQGLGAGGDAKKAAEFAAKSEDEIKKFIGSTTEMLFVAAGMGKGTGTGASPVVAKVAHEMGILTVGVVTKPFKLEGKRRKESAEKGIEEMSKYVDSLIVIDNQNLINHLELGIDIDDAYAHVDDILKNAVKCIAEMITNTYKQNVDFEDVKSILQNSGKALLGIATSQGENRVEDAIESVLSCPLLEDVNISEAQNFLFFVTYGKDKKLNLGELCMLDEKFEELQSENVHLIWGHGVDENLSGDSLKLSVVVSKFESKTQDIGETPIISDNADGGDVIFVSSIDTADIEEINQTDQAIEEKIKDNEQQSEINMSSEEPKVAEKEPDFSYSNSESDHSVNAPEPILTYSDDYENDGGFEAMIDVPAIQRAGKFSSTGNSPQPERSGFSLYSSHTDEFESHYALSDDMDDLFNNLAD